ncbi:Zinc finger, RING/FYVE/PHD-type [Phytophthora cactorum]|nr:Zinc finger, RING/FYVE/PHD-type [Phytophthora cactorum]
MAESVPTHHPFPAPEATRRATAPEDVQELLHQAKYTTSPVEVPMETPLMQLPDGQTQAFRHLAHSIVSRTLAHESEYHRTKRPELGQREWKLLKRQNELSIYKRRAPKTQEQSRTAAQSKRPMVLCVGSIAGELEDVLYGVHAKTREEMQVTLPYLSKGHVDCAMLAKLEGGSTTDPYRQLTLKWHLADALSEAKIMKLRDLCTLESMGISTDAQGERYAYYLLQSVDFAGCPVPPENSDVIRANMMFCCIYRQVPGSHIVDVAEAKRLTLLALQKAENWASSSIDDLSALDLEEFELTSDSTPSGYSNSASSLSSEVANVIAAMPPSLSRLLSKGHRKSRSRRQPSAEPCCVCSKKPAMASIVGATHRTCGVCLRGVCNKCHVKRRLFSRPLPVTVACCKSCLLEAKQLSVDPQDPCPMLPSDESLISKQLCRCVLVVSTRHIQSDQADPIATIAISDLPMLEDHSTKGVEPHVNITLYAPPAAPFVGLGTFDKVEIIDPSPTFYDHGQVNHRRLGVVGIVSILYVYLCAGPIGSEAVVSSAGPLVGLSGFILYALFVAFPFAYIVAELCSAFPEDGGFTVWVLNAFGPFWAFQVGYWSWVAGVLRGALMPGTLLGLLTRYYNMEIESSVVTYLIKAAIAIVLAVPTFLGTNNVGRLSLVVVVVVISCFSIFTVWAIVGSSDVDDLFQIRHEHVTYNADTRDVIMAGDVDIHWTTLLNTLFFKFKGMNNASVFGGEVQNPARSYARAIAYTCVLVLVTYLVPMTAGSCRTRSRGSCSTATRSRSLPVHVMTFLVSGMAENRLVPKILAKRGTKFQSPTNASLLTLVLMVTLVGLDFDSMLAMTNACSAAVQLVIIAAIIKLRRELPYIARPTKVPGGIPVLYAIAVIPTFMFGYVTFCALSSAMSAILMAAFFVPGVIYASYRFYYRRSPA